MTSFHLCGRSVFEGELSETIPVVHASIAGCRIIGRMCVGEYNARARKHTHTPHAAVSSGCIFTSQPLSLCCRLISCHCWIFNWWLRFETSHQHTHAPVDFSLCPVIRKPSRPSGAKQYDRPGAAAHQKQSTGHSEDPEGGGEAVCSR